MNRRKSPDVENERYSIVRDDNNNAAPDEGEPVNGPFVLPNRVHVENPADDGFADSLVVFTRDGSAMRSG